MEEAIRKGEKVRFRSRQEIEDAKAKEKGKFTSTWFLRGENTSIIKVQATPGGQLAGDIRTKLREIRAPDGGTTKVVEASGRNVMAGLSKADPFRDKVCPFYNQCWTSEKTDCWQTRTCYRATCCLCGAQYTGTSGHSIHKRTIEHMEAVRRRDSNNALAKHYIISHPSINTKDCDEILFKVEVLSKRISNLERYIEEAKSASWPNLLPLEIFAPCFFHDI